LSGPSPVSGHALAPVAENAQPPVAPTPVEPTFVGAFSALVQHNGPAAVNISSVPEEPVNLQSLWPPAAGTDDPFLKFFGRSSSSPRSELGAVLRKVGSGFIVRPDGYILTDARLVAGAKQVTVKLTDRREFKASIVGIDRPSGVALLKINARNLPTVKIGSPSRIKSGQWVVAVGAPYGFENTATAGIVSNTARLLPQETYIPLIQTDMTVATGDEGAPLFDLNGQAIGMMLVTRPPEGAYEGISFAIPIDAALQIEQQLLLHGRAEHGHLGVTIQNVSWPLAQSFGLKQPVGALITSVDRTGAAAKSGLRSGDIILQLNGTAIKDSTQLPVAVANLQPGASAHIQYWRDGRTHETVAVLGSMPGTTLASNGPRSAARSESGLTVRNLSPKEMRQAGVSGGVRVEQSAPAAELAGVSPGDIVLQVDHQPVSDAAQFHRKMKDAGNTVALLVLHDGQRKFVPLDLG
jgi:serine protease Do